MIFCEKWWLSAATGDKYRIIESSGKGISATVPIFTTKKFGLSVIVPPPFTRIFEPAIICASNSRAVRIEKTASILKDCLGELSGHKRVEFVLRPGSDLCLSFLSGGFSVEDAVTFSSVGPVCANEVWSQMHPKTRNIIRGAERTCSVIHHGNIDRYIALSRDEYRNNDRNDYTALRRLWSAITFNNAGAILSAVDKNGCDLAVAIVVWDAMTLYFLLTTRSTQHQSPGDNALLVWRAIEMAESNGLTFDLDGYHSIGALRFRSKFGLTPVARKRVFLNSLSWKFAELGRDVLRKFVPAGQSLTRPWEGQAASNPERPHAPASDINTAEPKAALPKQQASTD